MDRGEIIQDIIQSGIGMVRDVNEATDEQDADLVALAKMLESTTLGSIMTTLRDACDMTADAEEDVADARSVKSIRVISKHLTAILRELGAE